MGRPKEEKLDFLRNIAACALTYLRAGNDKTSLEESLMMMIEHIRDEAKRLGLSDESLASLPDSDSKPRPSKKDPSL